MSAKTNKRLIVHYQNEKYDISDFRHKHPGGVNTLKGIQNTDISFRFENAPPHSAAARYLMREYRIKPSIDRNDNQIDDVRVNDSDAAANEAYIRTDESMEYLVDWSKAMVPQIHKLGAHYNEWVHKPVDRSLRLFEQDYLEVLTKTPWWMVPAYWIPVIFFFIYIGTNDAYEREYNNLFVILNISMGVLLWTIIEYSLHRWLFHWNPVDAPFYICRMHFLLHGLHHKVPFDSKRLVFPPVPATVLATVFYKVLLLLSTCPKLLLAGGLIGYLCYDMIHYYIHHGSPSGGHLYNMKRYHYQHHFVSHDKGFGISSQLWDEAFGTRIILRKIKYLLKW